MQTLIANNPAFVLVASGVVPSTAMDKPFVAADTVNGNSFLSSGRDLLVIFNSDSASHTVTLQSAPDSEGRFANVTYTVNAGVYSFVEINSSSIFIQPGTNLVLFSGSSALLSFLAVMNA